MLVNKVYINKSKAPLYKTSLWVVVSANIVRSIDTIEDLIDKSVAHPDDKKSINSYTYGYEDHEGKMRVIVFFTPEVKVGTIAHEANHVKNIIFGWNGTKLSLANDEPESYFMEWLVDKMHNEVNKYKSLE